MKKTFKNKQELVDFVKNQVNIELENDKENFLNKKRKILYTKISDEDAYLVIPLFKKYGIAHERHYRERWFVYVRR
ncbi:hypothetical protein [Peptostreptococcus canis]|uniref:Homing endonuclease LAGLIDADG domain-containing protein n=1 Tax=Peptostreptococcus canis TaxID=1159213 RepID=A0ABR6TN40_9FIRM|nr:hypothetical protein [Peptostreptococcus canis]MBC2576558.1 hypothetical protein [Peptostreptococcus canis]MBP1998746.1 hypothetical protein [Peptostreptococcus canis]